MVIDENIPLLRTFRAELAKRSSMLVDEDMQEFFQQLNEFDSLGSIPASYMSSTSTSSVSTISQHTSSTSHTVSSFASTTKPTVKSIQKIGKDTKGVVLSNISEAPEVSSINGDLPAETASQHISKASGKIIQNVISVVKSKVDTTQGNVLHTAGVVNPVTKQTLTVLEAFQSGLIDKKSCMFINPKTKAQIPLSEAVKQGYVSAQIQQQFNTACGLLDPSTGKECTLTEAIKKGLFDPVTNIMADPLIGNISVKDANERGLISPKLPSMLGISPAVNVSEITQSQALFGLKSFPGAEKALGLAEILQKGMYDELKCKICDPISGQEMTILEAVEKGYVNPSLKEIRPSKGAPLISLTEAVAKGIIHPQSGQFLEVNSGKWISLSEAHRRQLLIRPLTLSDIVHKSALREDGSIFDANTNRTIRFDAAINSGILNADTKSLILTKTNDVLSFNDALQRGILDYNGQITVPGTQQKLSIYDALSEGHIKIASEDISFPIKTVLDISTGSLLSIPEAFQSGVLTSQGEFVDSQTGRKLSITDAARHGFIDEGIAERLTQKMIEDPSGKKLSVVEAINEGILDIESGNILDKSGNVMPLQHAVAEQILTPDSAQILLDLVSPLVISTTVTTCVDSDPVKPVPKPITISEAVSKGLLAEQAGTFKDPTTGEIMTIEDAIYRGLLCLSSEWPSSNIPGQFPGIGLDSIDSSSVVPDKPKPAIRQLGKDRVSRTSPDTPRTQESVVESAFVSKSAQNYTFTQIAVTKPVKAIISEVRNMSIKSVVDPRTRKNIDVDEAIETGLIDLASGLFTDPTSGNKLPINEAVKKGFIVAEYTSEPPQVAEGPIKETVAFSITGVLDPVTKERLSVSQAIQQGVLDQDRGQYVGFENGKEKRIPISQAIETGLVIAEDLSSVPQAVKADWVRETKTFNLNSVIHPVTSEVMTVAEAIHEGIIDESRGLYVNPLTMEKMLITEAIEKKLIDAELSLVVPTVEQDGNRIITTKQTTIALSSVVDPRTGKKITVNEAMKEGILNHVKGTYTNPLTGEELTLDDAILKKLIFTEAAEIPKTERAEISSIHITEDEETFETTIVEDVSSKMVTLSITSVVDPVTMEMVSYDSAVEKGVLSVEKGLYTNPLTGETMAITTALEKGLIHGEVTSQQTPEGILKSSIMAESPEFPLSKVTSVIDPRTGKEISLSKAMKEGIIDVDKNTFFDSRSREHLDLKEALNQGFIKLSKTTDISQLSSTIPDREASAVEQTEVTDIVHVASKSPTVVDMKLEKSGVTPSGAVDNQSIATESINIEFDVEKKPQDSGSVQFPSRELFPDVSTTQDGEASDVGISYAEATRLGLIDQNSGLITIPSLGTSMTISEAIHQGIIDPEKEAITDSKTGRKYTLQECFKTQKIDPKTGRIENEADRAYLQDLALEEDQKLMNLLDAVALGYFDAEKCLFHNKKGHTFTLEEAIKNNVISTDFISVKNLSTNEKIPFEKALKLGLVDKRTAEVTDTKNLKKVPLKSAIDQHIVESMYESGSSNIFDPKTQEVLSVDTVIQKGLESGSQMEVYDSKKNENVPLSEAIQRGLVDQKSGEITDSKSGKKLDAKEAVKIGLLAVVGAPIIGPVLAGKAVCDAVKKKLNEKSKPTQKPDVPPKPVSKEKQPTSIANAKKTQEKGPPVPKKPTTTIVYAKPDDKIKPSQPGSVITSETQSLIKSTSVESKVGDSPSSDSGVSSAQESILGKPVSYPSAASSDSHLTKPEEASKVLPSVNLKDGSNVIIDWEKGLVTDSRTGKQMSVTEAVQKGLLNTDMVENLAEQIVPQSSISKDVTVNWEKGQVTHNKTGESLSVTEALRQGLINTSTAHTLAKVTSEQMSSATLRTGFEEKKFVTSKKGQIDTSTSEIYQSVTQTEIVTHIATNGKQKVATSPSEPAMTLNDAVHGGYFVAETSKILDPKTGKTMSVKEAIHSGVIDGDNSVIIDPKSGNALSVNQAICERVVDPQTGELIHTQTKERIPLNEALLEGLIPDDTTTTEISVVPNEFDTSQPTVSSAVSNGVKEPLRKVTKCYSLKEAIDQGLINEQSGTFTDPVTKDVMSLAAAIQFGLIDSAGEEFELGSFERPQDGFDSQKTTIPSAAQLPAESQPADLPKGRKTTISEETKTDMDFNRDAVSKKPAVVSKIVTQSKESIVSEKTVSKVKNGDYSPLEKTSDIKVVKRVSKDREPDETSKRLSFAEALDQGFIDLAANQYTDPKTGSRMAILDAIREQIIDPTTESEVIPEPSGKKSLSLTTAIDAGLFDQSTCKFTEPMSGQQMSLEEAVDRGFINGQAAIYDLKSQKMLTLQDAWEKGKIDKVSGKFVDGDKKHSLKDAAKMGLIAVAGIAGAPLVAGGLLVCKAKQSLMKQTSPVFSTAPVAIEVTKSSIVQPNVIEVVKVKQITPVNEEAMTFMEAISSGFLNPKTGMYKIPSSGNSITLKEAIESGYIYPASGFITIADQSYSLQEAFEQDLLNDKGQLVDPKSKSKRTLDDFIKSGDIQEAVVDSHSSSKITIKVTDKLSIDEVLDPTTGKFIDLDSAMKKGIVNIEKGIYCNPITGQTFNLSESLNSDFIRGSMLDSLVSREEKTREGYKAAISFSEQKDICISSVTDPMSGEKMPLSEAVQKEILNVKQETFINQKTGETLSLDEALSKGYISAEECDVKTHKIKPSKATDEVTVTKRHSISISHVTDPQTHTVMPISDAVEEGLVDLSEGVIRNRKTGEQIPLAEAFKKGMVKGSEVISEPDSCPKDDLTSSGSRETLQVQSVFDPASGQFVSIEDAMKKGIINLESGTYTNKDGEKMSISESVKKGLCQSQKVTAQPKADGSELLPIKFVVDSRTGRNLTVTEAIEQGIVDKDLSHYFNKETNEVFSISKAIEKDLVKMIKPAADSIVSTREQETIRVTEVVDGRTGKSLSLDKAVKAGIFDPQKGEVVDITTGEHLPVQKAVTKGLVKVASTSPTDPSAGKSVFSISAVKDAKTGKKLSAEEAIRAGILDTEKNLFTDTLTGETISLSDAIKKNLVFEAKKTKKCDIQKGTSLHVNVSSVLDTTTGKELTLQEAIQQNIIDNEKKIYTDLASNKVYNLEDAMKEGFISGSVQSVVTTKTTVSSQKPGVTYNVTGAIDPDAKQMISMADAFEKGILDPAGNYVDIKSNTTLSITEAIQKGLVQAEIVENENIKSAKPIMTFKDALIKELIDCKTGMFTDPASTNSYSVDEAILLGILSNESGEPFKFLEGPPSPRASSFQESIICGLIDPTSGMFIDPKRRAAYTIQEAINQKYLSPKLSRSKKSKKESVVILKGSQVPADTKLASGMTFKQALDEGLLDIKAKRYHDLEKGVDISVEEAVKQGLLGDLTSGELMTFEDASKCGLIDQKNATFTNPVTNESLSLDEAFQCGFLVPSHDVLTTKDDKLPTNKNKPISLSEAMQKGNLDANTWIYTDPVSHVTMPLDKALQLGYVEAKVDTKPGKPWKEKVAPQDQYVTVTEGSPFSPEESSHYVNGELLSKSATEIQTLATSSTYVTSPGFYIDSAGKVVNKVTGDVMPLKDAIAAGLVSSEAVEGSSSLQVIGGQTPPALETDVTDSVSKYNFFFLCSFLPPPTFFVPSVSFSFCFT